VETVTDEDGTILHRGVCGAPDETTTVTDTRRSQAGHAGELAGTGGGGDWWPLVLPVG
jgi:hypothetical protein